MADVELTYKGNTIGSLSASGNLTLETAGCYCEDDIGVTYTSPGGGGTSGTYTPTANTLSFSIDIGDASLTKFLIYATTKPGGSGKKEAALMFVDWDNMAYSVVNRNPADSAWIGASLYTTFSNTGVSKSGSVITFSININWTNAPGYFKSGITYQWFAM